MVRPGLALAVLLGLGLALGFGAGAARAAELPRAMGMYPPSGPALAVLDSDVEVSVRGPIAEVLVTQRFQNRADHATEATYVFPLPADAAVTAMWIKTGARTLRGSIERREEAQRRYEEAIRKGASAGLLDQERPDVFTQTVAAIPARGTVEVTLRYDTLARYQAGTWELVLPMVVAPRYVPGAATARPTTGSGRAPDTDRAPDASRITPPGGPGAGGATDVVIRFADRVVDPASPTHELRARPGGAEIAFNDPRTDHDAIVRWRAAAPAGGWVEQGPDGGYAAVVVEAPAAPPRKGAVRCLLVLDRSAASLGDADAVARPFVRALLAGLGGADRVAIAGSDAISWSAPADAARALDQAWQVPAGAFDLTRVLSALRLEGAAVVLVSSGLVADDAAAIAAARKLGAAIHVVGVGPAPARGLLGQLAVATGGTLRYPTVGDDLAAVARATVADAAAPPPPLTVNWGSLAATEIVPGVLPRLGAGQATLVLARVKQAQAANARARGELFAIEALPAPRLAPGATSAMGPLARRWARERLEELLAGRAAPAAVAAHALRYGLVSPQTSLVAIGEDVIVEGGVKRSVAVPVSVPAGMRWQAVKKQTTVETGGVTTLSRIEGRDAPRTEQTGAKGDRAGDRDGKDDKAGATSPEKKPHDSVAQAGKPAPDPKTPPKGQAGPVRRPKEEPTKKREAVTVTDSVRPAAPTAPPPPAEPPKSAAKADDDADDGADEESDDLGSPRSVATADEGEALESVRITATSIPARERIRALGRPLRLTGALGGGAVVADGRGAPLIALSARIELGYRTMLGLGGSLWLAAPDGDLDAQGQLLATIARRGLWRWLELGGGLGLQLGAGVGPAGSASLRFHLPPSPRAAVYLKYDGALLYEEGARRGQSALTLGLEYGF